VSGADDDNHALDGSRGVEMSSGGSFAEAPRALPPLSRPKRSILSMQSLHESMVLPVIFRRDLVTGAVISNAGGAALALAPRPRQAPHGLGARPPCASCRQGLSRAGRLVVFAHHRVASAAAGSDARLVSTRCGGAVGVRAACESAVATSATSERVVADACSRSSGPRPPRAVAPRRPRRSLGHM